MPCITFGVKQVAESWPHWSEQISRFCGQDDVTTAISPPDENTPDKAYSTVADMPTGTRDPKSTVLGVEEEAIIVAFRRHALLPLDDCLYALQATIPKLARSSLHRCLQRHDISRLPDVEGDKPDKKKFMSYPILPTS